MLKYTCSKLYDNIPIAHRQQNHSGSCSRIHGHDWSFHFTFACNDRDPVTGFVVDFGDLKELKVQIDIFDHALALNESDKEMQLLLAVMKTTGLEAPKYFDIIWVEDCTCEGFAAYFFKVADQVVRNKTKDRAWVDAVVVREGRVNMAMVYEDGTNA